MNINLEIAKKLILKATKGKYHELKILADKAKINAAFERILYPDGYFWTYRFKVTKPHRGQTCSTPATGHKRTASQKNIMGGSEAVT